MRALRKLLSILLLFGLSLPFGSALLASGVVPGSGLPMCCRRGGTHECGMKMDEMAAAAGQTDQTGGSVRVQAPEPRCPWRTVFGTVPHADAFTVTTFQLMAGEALALASLPAPPARSRKSVASAHGSRGPPSLLTPLA